MASSEVDQKFLGRLAKAVENDNHLLSTMLFKILGLSLNLSDHLVAARKQRRPDAVTSPLAIKRALQIIWLSREGLIMLQQYVIPMVGNYVELKVLAYKLRASFFHVFVLFQNSPPVSNMGAWTPEALSAAMTPPKSGKGKNPVADDDVFISRPSSVQPTHPLEEGLLLPPPGFEIQVASLDPSFLIPADDYLPMANRHFKEAAALADELLWGSHSLRLSVKTEYVAFLYECVHDPEASRRLAKETIAQVYDAKEGMDDDMFTDACELVAVLGQMMKRGLAPSNTSRGKQPATQPMAQTNTQPMTQPAIAAVSLPPLGMENPI